MNSPDKETNPPKSTDIQKPGSAELMRDGLGLPHLAPDPAAYDSTLEPDNAASHDLDETVRRDKEAAERNAAKEK